MSSCFPPTPVNPRRFEWATSKRRGRECTENHRHLLENEGVIQRHLLRLVILAGEFLLHAEGDLDYAQISDLATKACRRVDERYTDRFLADSEAKKQMPV